MSRDEVVREMREHASEVFFSTLNDWADRLQAEEYPAPVVTEDRPSVELCNNEAGQIYWTPSQQLDGMPLGTYIFAGQQEKSP